MTIIERVLAAVRICRKADCPHEPCAAIRELQAQDTLDGALNELIRQLEQAPNKGNYFAMNLERYARAYREYRAFAQAVA